MHIHHFVQRVPPARGGSEAYFERLKNHLVSAGHSVTTWSTTAIDLEAFWKPHQQETAETSGEYRRYSPWRFPGRRYITKAISLLPHAPWQARWLPCNPICPAMLKDAKEIGGPVDAVHATAFPYAYPIYCAWRLARRKQARLYITPFLHLGDPTNPKDKTRRQYTSRPLRWLLKQADGVFVQTQLEAEAVEKLGVKPEQIILQGLGVDARECTGGDRDSTRASWQVPVAETVIGHLANASVEKGTVDLLKACELLWRQGLKFRVVLAGPEMANFKQYWDTFTFKQYVTRLGVISDADKAHFFAGIDSFALPSRSDSFGLVLLEAWANAKPVVVYKAGGPGELVQHERNGYMAPCGDVTDLALQLKRIITEPQRREEMGRYGQLQTQEEYLWPEKLRIVEGAITTKQTRVVTARVTMAERQIQTEHPA